MADILEDIGCSPEDLPGLYVTIHRCLVTGKSRLDLVKFLNPPDTLGWYSRELIKELRAWGIHRGELTEWISSDAVAKKHLTELYTLSSSETWEHLWELRVEVPLITSKKAAKILRRQLNRHFLDVPSS